MGNADATKKAPSLIAPVSKFARMNCSLVSTNSSLVAAIIAR
jgi:hypothetical protein